MKVLDIFSGIGGFSLGLERAGMETVAFCEIDPFCQKVLRKHWPEVPIYDDVRKLTRERLEADGITGIEVITGGFPCQDISIAGKQAGIDGERSGLWPDLARIISDIQPQFAIVENVTALLSGDRGRWFGRVLGDLAEIGYDAEWHCIPAAAIGAPHIRDRVWVLAYPGQKHGRITRRTNSPSRCPYLLSKRNNGGTSERSQDWELTPLVSGIHQRVAEDWWRTQSRMDRSVDGIPDTIHRNCALGNAVVPQIPELIGRVIMESE